MGTRENLTNQIAQELAEQDQKFNATYGIITGAPKTLRFRSIFFGRARILDAEIRIYGPSFLLLRWKTIISTMPRVGTRKFENAEDMLTFINNSF